jgi:signal transduction histidine kinase
MSEPLDGRSTRPPSITPAQAPPARTSDDEPLDDEGRAGPLARLLWTALAIGALAALAAAGLAALIAAPESSREALGVFSACVGVTIAGAAALPALFAREALARAALVPDEADADVDALYAAPQRAVLALLGLATISVLAAMIPWPWLRALVAPSLAALLGVCAFLVAPLEYVLARIAILPLAVRMPPASSAGGGGRDRVAARLTVAFAAPAAAAALAGALLIETRLARLRADTDDTLREQATEILALSLHAQDPGVRAASESLRAAGLIVRGPESSSDAAPVVLSRARPTTTLPLWGLLASACAVALAGVLGSRVGRYAAADISRAAERLSSVSARAMRSVTMHMARPRSVPEVREMALTLDALAAALLRMNEDRSRALIARRESARVRSFVLASVSHDLRAPLNSVLGFTDLVLSGAEGPVSDAQRESLEALSRGGQELLRLVRDFLDQSRLDADRLVLERTRTSMDGLIERARATAIERARAALDPEALTIEGEAGLHLLGDEERLSHGAAAFAAFALMRSGSNGRVVLRVRGEGDTIVLTVRGGGSTPSREALRGMFEPFDYAPAGARAPAGLSLAVNVAREVVRLHGGSVVAEPVASGGIAITVTLPIAASES